MPLLYQYVFSLHQIRPLITVLEMGPLRSSKGDLYKTFPAENVTFHKIYLFSWKGLLKLTLNSPVPFLKAPFPRPVIKGLISCSVLS